MTADRRRLWNTSSQIITATTLVKPQWTHPLTRYFIIVSSAFPRAARDNHNRNGRDRTTTTMTTIRVIHSRFETRSTSLDLDLVLDLDSVPAGRAQQ